MSDATGILQAIAAGDAQAAAKLLPLVYDDLLRRAAAQLAHEEPGHN
jgi:DNA-binding GntR family transcriptional regulator